MFVQLICCHCSVHEHNAADRCWAVTKEFVNLTVLAVGWRATTIRNCGWWPWHVLSVVFWLTCIVHSKYCLFCYLWLEQTGALFCLSFVVSLYNNLRFWLLLSRGLEVCICKWFALWLLDTASRATRARGGAICVKTDACNIGRQGVRVLAQGAGVKLRENETLKCCARKVGLSLSFSVFGFRSLRSTSSLLAEWMDKSKSTTVRHWFGIERCV